jgi:hypothetical protein
MFISSQTASAQTVCLPLGSDGKTPFAWGSVQTSATTGWLGVEVHKESVQEVVPHLEELQELLDTWDIQVMTSEEFTIGEVPVKMLIKKGGEVNVKVGRSYDYLGLLTPQQGGVVMKRLRRFVDGFKQENPSIKLWCYPNAADGYEDYRKKVFYWAGFRQDKDDGRMSR